MKMKPPAIARKRTQRGNELMEFALVLVLFVPLFMSTFITGFNVVRSIQANHIVRDLSDMYIHGADFSTYPLQTIAQRLATGMDLRIGSSYSGSSSANTSNAGRGLITVTQLMYVGSTSSPSCQAVLPQSCTNANSFVFTQRVQFGNGTLNSERPSSFGNPSITLPSTGTISSNIAITNGGAKLPAGPQADMQALWQVSGGNRTPLVDGQLIYAVEGYFKSPDLNLGAMSGNGVYARWFF